MTAAADKPKYLRGLLIWLQQVGADRTLPPVAVRVANILSGYVNQSTGDAFPHQKTLARELKITIRAVARNTAQLVAHGHLEVTIAHGRPEREGWNSNRYRPILKNPTPASGFSEGKPDASVSFSARKTRRARQENPTREARKPDAGGQKNPTLASCRTIEGTIDRTIEETIEGAQARESDLPLGDLGSDRSETKPRKRSGRHHGDNGFGEFYDAYPRHADRKKAEKAYAQILKKGEATAADLLAGARRYAAERSGEDPHFTKYPASWLNAASWKNPPAPPKGSGGNASIDVGLARLRRAKP